jgi:pimeloyl-ACP methyl ester carboxylesterase
MVDSATLAVHRGAMRAYPIGERPTESGRGVEEALYFASGDCKLFGWLHRPAQGLAARTGVVLCKPFGYEAICAHRGVRAFARAVASLGIPVLRFDYAGTGDSEDTDAQPDQLAAWTRDVVAAVAELRRRTGVDRVCLLGFRLGALLATLAARECTSVESLVLVAPIVSGSGYLRELRVARLASSLAVDPAQLEDETVKEGLPRADGALEASGFLMSAPTVAALSRLDLTQLDTLPVAEMLVIDRSDLPTARKWAEDESKKGIETRYVQLPGFVEMMLRAPQFALVPQPMIAAVREWLLRKRPETVSCSSGHRQESAPEYAPQFAVDGGSVLKISGDLPGAESAITERPLLFSSSIPIFGIVAEPRVGEPRRRAVILLNAGADYHIGASRMYVSLARRWAKRGYIVLRMDLAGLGDSDARPGRPDNEVFPPAALDDIRAAIETMRSRYGAGDVTLAGLCSGAYHALRAAVAGIAVNRILMVNPQNFFWKHGMTLEDLQIAEVVRNPVVYRERVLSGRAWRRLFSGEVNVWRIVNIYLWRLLLALESPLRDWARALHIRLPRDLGRELEDVAARGVRVVFIFSRGDPGIDLLRIQGGSAVKRLGDRCRVHIVDQADHSLSRSQPRAAVEEILCDELARHYLS